MTSRRGTGRAARSLTLLQGRQSLVVRCQDPSRPSGCSPPAGAAKEAAASGRVCSAGSRVRRRSPSRVSWLVPRGTRKLSPSGVVDFEGRGAGCWHDQSPPLSHIATQLLLTTAHGGFMGCHAATRQCCHVDDSCAPGTLELGLHSHLHATFAVSALGTSLPATMAVCRDVSQAPRASG